MAILRNGKLSVNISFHPPNEDWVKYDISFWWNELPIINNAIWECNGEFWEDRRPNSFIANESDEDILLPAIRKALDGATRVIVETLEPDLFLAIELIPGYEEDSENTLWESEGLKTLKKIRKSLKEKLTKLPDDVFNIVVKLNTRNFIDAGGFTSSSVGVELTVRRPELEAFYYSLAQEYHDYLQTYHHILTATDDDT